MINDKGRWNDVGCDVLRGYLCEIRAETSIPEPQPDWTPCQDQGLADQGFVQLRDSCYKLHEGISNFDGAEEHCRQYGEDTHLLSIMDIIEEDFSIVLSFKDRSDIVWLGLKKSEVNTLISTRRTYIYDHDFTLYTLLSYK